MKKTLDLPAKILKEAMDTARSDDENEVVIKALKEMIRKNKISEIKKYKGNVDLDIDLDKLRNRKWKF